MEAADYFFATLHAWNDHLLDVTDVVETQKPKFMNVATQSMFNYNGATKNGVFTVFR